MDDAWHDRSGHADPRALVRQGLKIDPGLLDRLEAEE
jgi:hypothetical protein